MKIMKSLPFRLLIGILLGMLLGFIAPSITKLGNSATRMLFVSVCIAYLSSVGAAFFSMGAGFALIPGLTVDAAAEGLRTLPDVAFQLDIPQIMPVMSALVLSILLGIQGSVWTSALCKLHGPFRDAPWRFCYWRTGCSGRYGHGLAGAYYRYPGI